MSKASPLTVAPVFELANQKGERTSLDELLVRGPVLLAFHRGTW
jgi:peroxiredoxin